MEIFKLDEALPEEGGGDAKERRITGLKQGVKNPNRVNVYVDGKYAFSLDVSQVVDLGVKVGIKVDAAKLSEFERASEFGKIYQRALEWILARPRSSLELKEYLRRKGRGEFEELVVERLTARGYLDDRKFAEYYVENRFTKKGISRKRLEMELMKKGVNRGIIAEVVGVRNDEEEIRKIIARKRNKYDDEKLISYLCRQGFSFELVRSLVLENETD